MESLGSTGAVVMARPATTVMENALLTVTEALSVTWTVKVKSLALVGEPLMAPDDGARVRPAGREPDVMLQVYGALPPTTTMDCAYATPTAPPGSVGCVVMVRAETMESVKALVVENELLSVTWTVKLKLPTLVGVPEIVPLDGLSVRPPGREPAMAC